MDYSHEITAGYAAVIGLVNSGKSTLVNAFSGRDICPAHSHRGITRIPVTSIYMEEDQQICFTDTPPIESCSGIEVLKEPDVVCVVLNSRHLSRQLNSNILQNVVNSLSGIPVIYVPTFIDYFPAYLHGAIANQISMSAEYDAIAPVCAPCGQGIKTLRKTIAGFIPQRPVLFPEGCISLHSERFLVSEQIRYSLYCALPADIAATTAVQIEEFSIRDSKRYVRANLHVSRHSNKGIVIGRRGSMLQKIAEISSRSSSRILDRPLNLDLWVKVRESWTENREDLIEFGYIC